MSKMSELDSTIKELRSAADAINTVANTLAELFSGNADAEPEAQEKVMTLPEVRAILAEKSRNGHRDDVRELLLKYGSDKLSGIDPAKYADLVAETEGWTDAT